MAYDLNLAERIKSKMEGLPFVEKKMFGGTGYLLNGNTPALHQTQCGASVACGILGEDLIVRVRPEKHADLLKRRHVKPFDFSGKPMKGWLVVEAEGVKFAATLPPK